MSELIPFTGRRINVVNVGGKNFTMESTATTRGQLEQEINAANKGVAFKDKKIVVGETKNSLDVADSLLPASNFTLFILPMKTKGGGKARNRVKELMQHYPVEAKQHFSSDKSYTVKKDTELQNLLETWMAPEFAEEVPASSKKEKVSKSSKKEKEMPADNGVADVVGAVASFKEVQMDAVTQTIMNIDDKVNRILMFLENQVLPQQMKQLQPPAFADSFHELEGEDQFQRVQREIERTFKEVRS